MKVELSAVQAIAPDQSSLQAAVSLRKPAKWSGAGISSDGRLIWAACAGSGANPYRVIADLSDLGHKCTCPSRKFPCKHALALLWMRSEDSLIFTPGDTPDWVTDWLSRRRKSGGTVTTASDVIGKDMQAAPVIETIVAEDPKLTARRVAAAEKRAAESEAAMLNAVDALEGWVADQLRLGLAAFIADATGRCRQIAARLADGKAAVLAGRLDELPSHLLTLPASDRIRGAVIELGKLICLTRAYRASPKSAEVRRFIGTAENRETLLEDPATLRVNSIWEVVGEKVSTRRDGLISHTSWLLNVGPGGPVFAVLLDFYPASSGRRGSVFTVGEQFDGEVAFYPSQHPERALLLSRTPRMQSAEPWPRATQRSVAAMLADRLCSQQWLTEMPVVLPPGRIALDSAGAPWWKANVGDDVLPVEDLADGVCRATELECTAAVVSARGLCLLAAQSPWGRIRCVS